MQWFKHSTNSHDDPDISDCEDQYGDAGYVVFFKICEIYGQEFRHLSDGWLDVSQTFLRRKLRKSWTKVQQILSFYQTKNRISFTSDGHRVKLKIPKYIDLASNWTGRQDRKPTEAPTEAPTAKDLEVEKTKKEKTPIVPLQGTIDIYDLYPRKVGRGAGIKAIEKALKKVDAETLKQKVIEYAKSVAGKDKQYIPHASTWFNEERWKDEIEVEDDWEREFIRRNKRKPHDYERKSAGKYDHL